MLDVPERYLVPVRYCTIPFLGLLEYTCPSVHPAVYNFVLAEENMVEHSGKSAFVERRNRSNNFDSMMMKSSLWKSQGDAILSAAIGGARYGIKIRFPHALVMTLLFQRHLTNREKINRVLKLVWIHSSNLAGFATLYKVCVNVIRIPSFRIC